MKFPQVVQKILKKLNNQDLAKFKEVSKFLSSFLEKDRFFWKRILQKYGENHAKFKETWISVTEKMPVDELKELTLAVEKFYTYRTWRAEFQHSPLHIVAECGNLMLFKEFTRKTGLMNPERNDGLTPFHFASQEGRLDICQFLISNLDNKNPKNNKGQTPLHKAAKEGHFEICSLITNNVEDKNPADDNGCTPLHDAAQRGHFEVCKLIIEKLRDKRQFHNFEILRETGQVTFLISLIDQQEIRK